MPALLERFITVKTPNGPVTFKDSSEDVVSVEEVITATCEGPRCRRGPQETRKILKWSVTKAKQDVNEVPDDAFRLITTSSFNGEKHVFCSVACEHDWQRAEYTTPLSPKEQAAQAASNAEVERKAKVLEMPPKQLKLPLPPVIPSISGGIPVPTELLDS